MGLGWACSRREPAARSRGLRLSGFRLRHDSLHSARTIVIPNWTEGPEEPDHLYTILKPEARQPKPLYRNSSIAASSASLPGRVTDSGSVASGSSTMFSMSRKLGALVFT